MMKEINFEDYDTLTIYAKKHKIIEIKEKYSCFGWTLIRENENNRYEDLIDLQFARPHKFKNKDELQLLQIYMEENLNKLGKLENNKYAKTTASALFFDIVGIALFVLGILAIFNVVKFWGLAGGLPLIIVGVLLLIIGSILTPKLYKKECSDFASNSSSLTKHIEEVCSKAQSLIGDEK